MSKWKLLPSPTNSALTRCLEQREMTQQPVGYSKAQLECRMDDGPIGATLDRGTGERYERSQGLPFRMSEVIRAYCGSGCIRLSSGDSWNAFKVLTLNSSNAPCKEAFSLA